MRSVLVLAATLAGSCSSGPREPALPAPAPAPDAMTRSAPPIDATPADAAVDAAPDAMAALQPDLVITLKRTACFGTCPVTTLTVNAAGDVFFASWYPKRGCATTTITAAAVADLARAVDASGFFGLKDRYTTDVTDYPSARTSVVSGGREKHVHHYLADPLGAPDLAERNALSELERTIDATTGARALPLGLCKGRSPYPDVP